jgi:YggT family protein
MDHGHPVIGLLGSVTDPYLNWFRRFRFLILGNIDFTPLAALLVLNFLSSLARMIGVYGQITLGNMLAILFRLTWDMFSVFLLLVGVLSLVRFLAVQFRWGGAGIWAYLDAVLQPPAMSLGRMLRPKSFLPYTTTLLLLTIVNLAGWALGEFLLVPLITQAFQSIPV